MKVQSIKEIFTTPVDTGSSHSLPGVHRMGNIGGNTIQIKVTWDTQYETFVNKDKFEVEGNQANPIHPVKIVTTIFHMVDKPDGNMYDLILGRDFNSGIGLDILNGDLASIWYGVKVSMVEIGYWNNKIVDDYQCHRSTGYLEESQA